MITITLYTKEDCGLCDEVKEMLSMLVSEYPHTLSEIDITQDNKLYARYRFSIPVIKIGDKTLKAPITAVQLKKILANNT